MFFVCSLITAYPSSVSQCRLCDLPESYKVFLQVRTGNTCHVCILFLEVFTYITCMQHMYAGSDMQVSDLQWHPADSPGARTPCHHASDTTDWRGNIQPAGSHGGQWTSCIYSTSGRTLMQPPQSYGVALRMQNVHLSISISPSLLALI